MYDYIEENIKRRGFETDFDRRIKFSILRAIESSGRKLEELKISNKRRWGESMYAKLEDLGLMDLFPTGWLMDSHAVHGNWQDLISFHLKGDFKNGYVIDSGWHDPRPIMVFSILIIGIPILREYVDTEFPKITEKTKIVEMLSDLWERNEKLMRLYLEFRGDCYEV
ncbi:MAG: hypothetical protein CO189_06865 [candidate division Zixibacteria bacterium CG_4_9_14_3_um_filter_46_8]|nr:MAG: hypothetical protein CO189_06865 [candidate division Zixibacteria bacterium CG_4_9_14_3_um_filter_46_8]